MRSIKYLFLVYCTVESAVLDPALYLAPSPPLLPSSHSMTPEKRWAVIPEQVEDLNTDITVVGLDQVTEKEKELELEKPQPMIDLKDSNDAYEEIYDKEEIPTPNIADPWNIDRSFNYGLQVPLTFSYTGGYGGYKRKPSLISPHYVSTGLLHGFPGLFGSYGDSALAGSSYRSTYGSMNPVRIYGNSPSASWSGWGNGKWGHYGKG